MLLGFFLIGVFNLNFLSSRIEAFRIIYGMVGYVRWPRVRRVAESILFSVRCRGGLTPGTARLWVLVSLSECSGPRNSKWSIL